MEAIFKNRFVAVIIHLVYWNILLRNSNNISSITSTTIGSASTTSGNGGAGGDNCSTSTHSAGSSGQTPSCKALAGSLTSFDTSLVVNTEGN